MKANINTDSFIILRQRGWLPFTGKHDVPFAGRRTLNSAGFHLAFNWTVQYNLDVTYLGKPQYVTVESEARLRKGEAVIAAFPTEARIARLFASLNPAEERLKSKVNADGNILQDLRMYAGKGRPLFFECGEAFCLGVVVNASLAKPAVSPCLKAGVLAC